MYQFYIKNISIKNAYFFPVFDKTSSSNYEKNKIFNTKIITNETLKHGTFINESMHENEKNFTDYSNSKRNGTL